MSLPIIQQPIFKIEIPSTKKTISMRPMVVREEKLLLMAKESAENNAIMQAVKQCISNCIVEKNFDIDKLTLFDIDYLFINLRANSIDNIVKLTFTDNEDDPLTKVVDGVQHSILPEYPVEIDLSKVSVKFPDEDNRIIKLGEDAGLKLKYPEASIYESKKIAEAESEEKIFDELVLNCFESYFEGKNVYNFKDSTREEIEEFIDNLNINTYQKVVSFFSSMPTLYYKIEFTTKKGKKNEIELTKLTDFFTF